MNRSHAPDRDRGAAAVEFALLFPIFAIMTMGVLTAGIAYWHNIALTQGARDAARLGSTYPISTEVTPPPGETSIDNWLTTVAQVAADEAGWSDLASVPSVDDGYICVAYVPGTTGTHGSVVTQSKIVGTADATAGENASTASPCYIDNRPDTRVQVMVRRRASFNALVYTNDWYLRGRTTIRYEREAP